jgi:RNase P/RNase MRP subunit p29
MNGTWMRAAIAAAALAAAGTATAADKTYQVTGPVVDVTDTSITVQKGKENWQIAKTADTKVSGDVKKGDKVTVMYPMTATSIEAKAAKEKGAKKAAAK